MEATLTFDPAGITAELLDGLTNDRLRAVIEHHGLPRQPKSASKKELLALARLAVAPPVADALPEPPQAPVSESENLPALVEPNAPASVVPEASRWQLIVTMAEYLSTSSLTPDVLRGKDKVHDLGAILLRANDLGIPLTSALEQLYVIKGKVGMESKLMRALVRRDGHSILDDPASDKFSATVHGRRSDPPYDTGTGTFDLNDAQDYDLIAGYTVNDDGTFTVRPVTSNGKSIKPQWVTDTANMLKQRATARLCRDLFSDCLAGVSYTPDELGFIDSDPADEPHFVRAGEAEQTMTIAMQRDEIERRIGELPELHRLNVASAWRSRNLPRVQELTPAGIRAARSLIEPAEMLVADEQAKNDAIPDAELGDDDGAESSGQESGESEAASQPPLGDGIPPGSATASPDPGLDEPIVCIGCGELVATVDVFLDADGQPWHTACSPM